MAKEGHMTMGILDLKKKSFNYYYNKNKNSTFSLLQPLVRKLLNNNKLAEMGKEVTPCESLNCASFKKIIKTICCLGF